MDSGVEGDYLPGKDVPARKEALACAWDVIQYTRILPNFGNMTQRQIFVFLRAGSPSAQLVYGLLRQNPRDGVGAVP